MKNKFLCLLALLCLLPTLTTWAQTTPNAEDELHQLYWTYRNRYKLYFTHIGNDPGDCVPISARMDFSTNNDWCDYPNGYIKYGDGTSQMGFYLGLLATEFKLLKDEGQPVQPTLNELYYVIRSLHRLDKGAEKYYDGTLAEGSLNGFFLRDDVDQDTRNNWSKSNIRMTEADAYRRMNKTGDSCLDEPNLGRAPEMSKDQMACLVMGIAMVKKMVVPDSAHDIFVQPTTADSGIFLLASMQQFVHNYMTYIFEPITYNFEKDCLGVYPTFNVTCTRNLRLANPVTGELIDLGRGGDVLDMIYPLCLVAQDITGVDYFEWEFYYRTTHANSFCSPMVEVHLVKIKDFLRYGPDFPVDGFVSYTFNPSAGSLYQISRVNVEAAENNSNVFSPMAAVHGKWIEEDFRALCANLGMQEYYLLYSVMFDKPDMRDRDFWIARFSQMNKYHNSFRYDSANHYNHANTWQHNNRPEDKELEGFYGGYDFMLAYNLFRIKYPTEALVGYKENSCDCGAPIDSIEWVKHDGTGFSRTWVWQNPTVILPSGVSGNINALSSGTKLTEHYHTDYIEKGTPTYNYLSLYDYEVLNTGILQTKGNSILCNGKILTLKNGGQLVVGGDLPEEKAEFRVRAGTGLRVYDGGIIKIKNNSRLIIEPGAYLLVDSNTIILEGANAVLEIQGVLIPSGLFKPTGDGYVLFNNFNPGANGNINSNGYNITTENPNGRVNFSSANGTKRVEIVDNTIVKSDVGVTIESDLCIIECGENAGFQIEGPVNLARTVFRRIPSNTNMYAHYPLTFYGQKDIRIWSCGFYNAKTAITNYKLGNKMLVTICTFDSCRQAMETFGGGGTFVGNTFQNNSGVWRDPSAFNFATFEHNLVKNNQNGIIVNGALTPFVGFMGNVFTNNTNTLITNGSTDVSLICNQFTANTINGGVYMGNSYVSASHYMAYQQRMSNGNAVVTGNNIFTLGTNFPEKGILMFNGARYRFDEGYNTFNNNYSGLNPFFFYSIYGDFYRNVTAPTTPNVFSPHPDLNFVDNAWNTTPVGTPFNNILDINQNKQFKHFDLKFTSTPTDIYGYAKVSTATCPVSQWADAMGSVGSFIPSAISLFNIEGSFYKTLQINPGQGSGDLYTSSLFPTSTTFVNTGAFAGQAFHIAARNALLGTYNGAQTIDGLTVNLTGLLNLNTLLINTVGVTSDNDKYIWAHAFGQYTSLLSEAKYAGAFNEAPTLAATHLTAALSLYNSVLSNNQSYVADTPRYYDVKLNTNYLKAHTYSLFADYNNALTTLGGIAPFVKVDDSPLLDVITCITNNEKLLADDSITKEEYISNVRACMEPFTLTYNVNAGITEAEEAGSGPQYPVTYTITPNPATTLATVTMNLTAMANVDVSVFDKFGIKVLNDQHLGNLTSGQHTTMVNVSGLSPDTYTMAVYVNGVPYVKHFLKVN